MSEPEIQEIWQVEAAGKIYDTSFDEMTAWIADGALIRDDKVRKGNLRWIEAGKVPALVKFFNAKDAGSPIIPVVTTTDAGAADVAIEEKPEPAPVAVTVARTQVHMASPAASSDVCSIHLDVPAAYVCDSCSGGFCKACPHSYGGTVKICPSCGAMCRPVAQVEKKKAESDLRHRATTERLGFGDFFAAFGYPFRFTTSLIFGAVMFALFSLGQSAGALGGLFLVAAALISYVLANMLTFGVLANTVENFSQGKINENFMPSFEDFSLWDDVVHPFFLSIGVYLSSFGPLIVLGIVTVFFVLSAARSEMNAVQSDLARKVNPGITLAANAAKQSERVRDILNKDANQQQRRVEAIESGEVPDSSLMERKAAAEADAYNEDTEAMVAEANDMINKHRKAQLESVVGKTPETVAQEREALVSKILGYGVPFLLLGGVFLFWGMFYFPAACAVAGYTRSFAATLNPSVGLDTIKRLGLDYVKILFMTLVIVILSGLVAGVVSAMLRPFDMPGTGNLPAIFIGSLFTFYFSVVFSCVLGFAIFKNAHKLDLAR